MTVYFSHTGNTRTVARQIHAAVGGDILELQTVQTYPADHDSTVRQAEKEEENNFRPQLSTQFPEGMNDYDIIFVGYPVWVYTMPMALYSFFDQFKFPGKTIVPFSTHLGSGLADGPKQIARLCPQATVSKGLAIRGNRVASSQDTVNDWLHGLGITKQ
ncbi:MAG: flavodoxin [Bilophila wadsworthia]